MGDWIEKINVTNWSVVLFCGIGMMFAIYTGEKDIGMALAGGLVGFLGGNAASK